MAVPHFITLELRATFRSCAYKSAIRPARYFSCARARYDDRPRGHESPSALKRPTQRLPTSKNTEPNARSKELVTQDKQGTAVDTNQRPSVPMRVIPRGQLNPKAQLSPRERLHVEMITRRAPQQIPQEKKIYREKLPIYHWGHAREKALIMLRIMTIAGVGAATFIIGPAHYVAGHWYWPLIMLSGWIPFLAISWWTAPMITRVFLRLPPKARETAKAAMEYANNLPRNAELDIRFIRHLWPVEGSVVARLNEFQPVKPTLLRVINFKWLEKYANPGPWYRPNPTSFSARPTSDQGKAARDTIPNIWENVFRLLTGSDAASTSRWRR